MQESAPTELWRNLERTALQGRNTPGLPNNARALRLNTAALADVLNRAPREFKEKASEVILPLPLPDGSFARFRLEESPVLVPEVAAQYPEIKSYRGQALDNPALTMRCDWSPRGFHALLLGSTQSVTIQPAQANDAATYVSYDSTVSELSGICGVTADQQVAGALTSLKQNSPRVSTGNNLRTYRIAIATTQEYTNDPQLGGGTVAGAVASLNTWINAVNVLYERDLAVRLLLVTNNALIFTAEPDPFTNGNEDAMLDEIVNPLRNVIGAANYDLGHVLGTGGSGVAGFGVVCSNTGNSKERGASRMQGPVGGGFTSLLAHEIGHQFGASHTHNALNCAGRTAETAFEAGGGLSLMAYRGNCTGNVLAITNGADVLNFHASSIVQVQTFLATTACAATVATGNNPPVVSGGPDYTIPRNTPFTLTAVGNDPDLADVANLTYAWHQVDSGGANFANPPYNDAGDPPTTTRPIFRPFGPTASPARTFPSLTYILNNANTPPDTLPGQFGQTFQTAEQLPRVARQINFRVVLRDNRAGGGGLNDDNVTLTVDGASGPFLVTAPNTAVTWTVGSQQTVTWSINNTNAAPINAASVRLTLSVDGGQSFPFVLAASVPNNGTANVTVPNGLNTTAARVKVEALGNIFFDISDVNFAINAGAACPNVTALAPSVGNPGTVVTLTGVGLTGVTAVRFSNNVAAAAFNVVNDTTLTATVPAGAVTGPLTLSKATCPEVTTPVFVFCTNPATTLQVDDNGFEGGAGGTYFANRLTPATYPASLRSISLQLDVPAGTNITLLTGANPSGNANINDLPLQRTAVTAGPPGQFREYNVPALTLGSGDFVVGCFVEGTQFPIAFDTTTPQMRSYNGFGGTNWNQLNDRNYPIRAQILTGCGSGVTCPMVTGLTPNNGSVGTMVNIAGANFAGVTAVRFSNNVNAAFTVNGDSQITATVPNGAVTGPLTIVRPNCPDAQTAAFTVNPINCATVTGVNPPRAAVGGTVTITGTNLTGVSIVKFTNEVSAVFTVDSDAQITATVPNGATPGPITLSKTGCPTLQTAAITLCNTPLSAQVDDGTQQGASGAFGQVFLVNRLTPMAYPATLNSVIIRFDPFQAIPTGTAFTLLGAANPNGGANIDNLAFQQVNAQVGTLREFVTYNLTTPVTINAGDFVVGFSINRENSFPLLRNTNNPQGRSYSSNNGTNFAVIEGNANLLIRAGYTLGCGAGPVCATVTNLNPTTGMTGAQVVITGTGLTGVTGVRFSNNVAAQFTADSDTQITATVPAGAVTGPLTITKPGCADVQTAAFTVTAPPTCPTITNLTPAEGLVAAQVMLTGTNFTGVTGVAFSNNVAAQFNVVNDTQITATVPAGAVTGPLTLTKPNCADTLSAPFTVLPPADPMLDINNVEAREGNGANRRNAPQTTTPVTFTVTLGGVRGYNQTITVNYATADNTALAGSDYIATSGTLNFAPPFTQNTATRTITVLLINDNGHEANEDFFVNLSGAVNAVLHDGQGDCTILDDDCVAFAFAPSALPNALPGVAYQQQLSVSGGQAPYFFALAADSTLPPGLNLSPTGLLAGTPTQNGVFSFAVEVDDDFGCFDDHLYTLRVGKRITPADFDGDGQADLGVWRGNNGNWLTLNSGNGQLQTVQWGAGVAPYNDVIVPGDYDGDGKADQAIWRGADSIWYIRKSSDGQSLLKLFGSSNAPYFDVPAPADYDGDGKTDIAVWRPADGRFYVLKSSDGGFLIEAWGTAGDKPVPGDYDGDGKADFAVWRPGDGNWYIKKSSGGFQVIAWGAGAAPFLDVPVPADFDGDGKADCAVWRTSSSTWYIRPSATPNAPVVTAWGASGAPFFDTPAPADFDGDGKADIAVWRRNNATWYVLRSSNGTYLIQANGQSGDTPIPGAPR
ncbi:MAG: VCBS repeat-containing protein [Acidobacteria bacterium]|nr:VCBS repeat-containing protein [Acidobacteriota bacterium]MBI3422239.1 VCBS repeat-containing protein [Acidobacteriota bacterium]